MTRFNHSAKTCLLATVALLALQHAAMAGAISGVTSATALGGNDQTNIGALGAYGTSEPSPLALSTTNGLTVSVTATGGFYTGQEYTSSANPGNVTANFSPGQKLLVTNAAVTDVLFTFSAPVEAFGLQTASGYDAGFTATMDAYDSLGSLLGSYSEAGNTSVGSAIFIGVSAGSSVISSVVLTVSPTYGTSTIFSDATLLDTASVPEPNGLLTLLPGILAIGYLRHRRGTSDTARPA